MFAFAEGLMMKFRVKSTAYIIANNLRVEEVRIVNASYGTYIVKLLSTGGGFRVHESRLYPTKEEAEKVLNENNETVVVDVKEPEQLAPQQPELHSPHYYGWV